MTENLPKTYFLDYQKRWLADRSRIKIWEKSRRIGATYVSAFEDVRDSVSGLVPSCWFSSADESAAREYIEYCLKWAKVFNVVAEPLGEQVVDESKGVKAYEVKFKNGVKIHALSSNPKAFRSKGGKVVLDEFAWHEDPKAMWAAARPCITWGFPLRILSTHNGMTSLYNQFVKKSRDGILKDWMLHSTDIFTAVKEGLADKILRRQLTDAERADWIEQERESVADDNVWLEEYCCRPQDEKAAFLTYEQITAIQRNDILKVIADCTGPLYLGMDVGRRHDLTVIWIVEEVGSFLITRAVIELKNTPFREQKMVLYDLLRFPTIRRGCLDATGLGMQLAEDAQNDFGTFRIEPVTFSGPVKEALAYGVLQRAQDKSLLIPESHEIRADFHSIRKVNTAAGNIRFDVSSAEAKDSHADRFWGCSLSVHAASTPATCGDIQIETRDIQSRRGVLQYAPESSKRFHTDISTLIRSY
jgi:phage FluMu gp28-like protein